MNAWKRVGALARLGLLVAVGAAFATSQISAADAPKVPKRYEVRDFFGKPERTGFSLSPDGKSIAFVAPYERRMNIHTVALPAGGQAPDFAKAKRLTAETARDIAGYFWKGNSHILYAKDFGGDENFHVVSVDAAGTVKDLTPFPKVQASIVDDLRDDPDHVLVQYNQRNPQVFDVYKINVASGVSTLVAENPGNITGWITDHKGQVRAATTTDGVNASLLYRATEKDSFKTVLTTDFRTTVQPMFFTFDNKNLYAISNRGRDKTALVVLDPVTGKEAAPLFEHPEVDVNGADYSRKRKVLTFAGFETWKGQRHFFDDASRALFGKLEKQLPGYEVHLVSWNLAEDKAVIAAVSDRTPGARYLYDVAADQLTKLADINPNINPADMAAMKPVTYTSRDGLKIQGYLTLPVGRAAKNLPVIINPHGGPWARDSWGFNREIQFLANRGYATLAGVTYTPDLYAAAVDYVGVANLFTWFKAFPPYWKPFLDMVYVMVGDPVKDQAQLEAASPAFHADKIKTPLFVAQGANDPRVNKNESDQMVEALKKRGVQVQYMVKDNEGHGFHNEENQIEFYGAMEQFLGKYLSPQ
jgi:dipeptidyl aminopeptidase/acylaminoacyl peptidase